MPAESSEVAALARNQGTPIDSSKPYAELWMGTHPSGPSLLLSPSSSSSPSSSTKLKEWVESHPAALGQTVLAMGKGGGGGGGGKEDEGKEQDIIDLPFLFKVLSVNKALSIQAHPNKTLARKLHKERPQIYKDPNHKPEMTVAITPFEALSSFLPSSSLVANFLNIPELILLIGEEAKEAYIAAVEAKEKKMEREEDEDEEVKRVLRETFTKLMTASPDIVAKAVQALVTRLVAEEEEGRGRKLSPVEKLVLRLQSQYPDDVGIFCCFFLNYVILEPGEGIYLAANEPHAYLSGQCVEVMATSDNVVRAGLTPKLRDTDVLCEMLTYKQGPPEILRGEAIDTMTKRYSPPFDEFELEVIKVKKGFEYTLPQSKSPTILLATEGEGRVVASGVDAFSAIAPVATEGTLAKGVVYFVVADAEITVSSTQDCLLYRAKTNSRIF